jgi:hypothetical protein
MPTIDSTADAIANPVDRHDQRSRVPPGTGHPRPEPASRPPLP